MPWVKVSKKISSKRGSIIVGWFQGKYFGMLNDVASYANESIYDIKIYEGCVHVDPANRGRYCRLENLEAKSDFVEELAFKGRFPDPILCYIQEDHETIVYQVTLEDISFIKFDNAGEHPLVRLFDQQVEGNEVFGSIEGYVCGHLYEYETKEVIEEQWVPESAPIPTQGQKEKQSTKRTGIFPEANKDPESVIVSLFNFIGILAGLLGLLFLGVYLLPLIVVSLISFLVFLISRIPKIVFNGLAVIFLIFCGFSFLNGLMHLVQWHTTAYKTVSEKRTEDQDQFDFKDSIIYHHRIWEDYKSRRYEANIGVRLGQMREAASFRNSLSVPEGIRSYETVLSAIIEKDSSSLGLVYTAFDSVGRTSKLDKLSFASMIVSCIQDMNYCLLLPDNCDPQKYKSGFIGDYLRSGGRCEGIVRFGLYCPSEFLAKINGDCDTRTLALYAILSHYNYPVAILSSDYYGHSLLAVGVPSTGARIQINGVSLALWETTYKGFAPGELPVSISDLTKWEVTLTNLQKPNIVL